MQPDPVDPPMPLTDDKARLRSTMRSRRSAFARGDAARFADAIAARFRDIAGDLGVAAGGRVAAYWPIGDEADVRALMTDFAARGAHLLLPVVVKPGAPLIFRRWTPGLELEAGPLGTRQPGPDAEAGVPDLVLAPLLAFDRKGYRLGQGGGYYDRTLSELRDRGRVAAVGVGYACQQVDTVPHGPDDARLDWIVTEETAFRTKP